MFLFYVLWVDYSKVKNVYSIGWFILYDEENIGFPKGLISLIAVVHQNKSKVKPGMDYRKINFHVNTYTADADICAENLESGNGKGRTLHY